MTGERFLIKRAQKGEVDAFEQLVTAYEKKIYNMALRYTGSREDAADVTQEVFLRAYRSLADFRGDSAFSTWLYRTTINQCVDLARKKTVSAPTAPLESEEGAMTLPDPDRSHDPEQALENAELRRELNAALKSLSGEHRDVIVLRDISGLSYSDIAHTLELEEGTVKSRLARARKKLREILLERGNISAAAPSNTGERRRKDG